MTKTKNENLSDQQISEKAKSLKYERNTLETIINSLPGLFYQINQEGKYELWNKNFKTITGYSDEEMEGFQALEFFAGEDKEKVAASMEKVFDTGYAEVEADLITKDGESIPYLFTGTLRKINGKPYLLGLGFDISDRKKAEEKLESLNKKLKKSNQELQEFAYVASHDLQEPLRMVSSFTSLLEKRYGDKLDKDGKEFIQYAVEGSERMKNLINDLLKFSRVQTKAKPFEKVNVEEVLNDVIKNLEVKINETNAKILYGDLPTIKADKTQLINLFQNLIHNGIKFRAEEDPKIEIDYEEKKNYCLFSVKDNGIGIDKKYAKKIFRIFQRLHSRDKHKGTGIGLAVCKRIVERHGGNIWVESESNEGTTFKFTLKKRS